MNVVKTDNASHITALTERLGRLLITDAHASSALQPVQWDALRYLNRANRFSRNSSALTAYLGSTKGTVSQTVKALESKNLIRNQVDPKDRRRNQLSLTAKGKRLLGNDPIGKMTSAIEALPEAVRANLAEGLEQLLSNRLDTQDRKAFGQCQDCIYFAVQHDNGQPHYCRLLKEGLSEADSQLICHEQVAS